MLLAAANLPARTTEALATPAPAHTATPARAAAMNLGPVVNPPKPTTPRNMDEPRRNVARRMVAGSPNFSYMGGHRR